MSNEDYEAQRDRVALAAWEVWTENGLGLDDDQRDQTVKSVSNAAANTYQDGMTDIQWLAAVLQLLGVVR